MWLIACLYWTGLVRPYTTLVGLLYLWYFNHSFTFLCDEFCFLLTFSQGMCSFLKSSCFIWFRNFSFQIGRYE